jgi:hypothetical protein
LKVFGKFVAPVLVCRAIVAYELRGVKAVVQMVDEEGELGQSLSYNISNSIPGVDISGTKGIPNSFCYHLAESRF